jgi:hypothetical protein
MTIGARLREARTLAGVGSKELDRLAQKTPGHANTLESERIGDATTQTASAYASVLGISLDWLIAGKGPEPIKADVRAAVAKARERLASTAAARAGARS